jgi:ketosteroid isomerase-like protein
MSRQERRVTAERLLQSILDGAPDSALVTTDFEYEQHFGFTAGRYVGEKGLQRWIETFYEVWDRASVEFEGVRETDDRIALDFRVLVRARQTGIEVELRATGVCQFARDGRIARMDSFNDASAAAERLAASRG